MARNPKPIRKGPHRWMKLLRLHASHPTSGTLDELKVRARQVFEGFWQRDLEEYHRAMARLEQLFPVARKGAPEGDEFERLTAFITDWEQRHDLDKGQWR